MIFEKNEFIWFNKFISLLHARRRLYIKCMIQFRFFGNFIWKRDI